MKIQKKKQPTTLGAHNTAADDGDEWLLTYADMVTLLLCFFAVLVGMSKVDMLKVEQMTQHFSAKKQGMTMQELSVVIADVIKQEQLEDKISVQVTSRGIEINFKDKLLFDLGQAELKPEALEVLSKMSKLINHKDVADKLVYMEGHTDSIPIKSMKYPSNWELSSARAASVVRFLVSEGMNSRKFVSIGHADTWPLVPEKDTTTGSPVNRRVVAVITPETYQQ